MLISAMPPSVSPTMPAIKRPDGAGFPCNRLKTKPELSFESTINEGTTFIIRLPMKAAAVPVDDAPGPS